MKTRLTPKSQTIYNLFTLAKSHADNPNNRDSDWAVVVLELKGMLPTQSCLADTSNLAPVIERLKAGESIRSVCADVGLSYVQLRPVLSTLGWSPEWRWNDKNRRVGAITIRQIEDEYKADPTHGVQARLAELVGVTPQRINQVLVRLGLVPGMKNHDRYEGVIKQLDAGASIVDVAKLNNITESRALSWVTRLRRAGLAKPHRPGFERTIETLNA